MLQKLAGRPRNKELIPIVDFLLLVRNNFEIVIPKIIDNNNANSRPTNTRPRLDDTDISILTKVGKPKIKPNNKPVNKSIPEPPNKELLNILNLIISSKKQKEHNKEDDRAVKRLRVLLA